MELTAEMLDSDWQWFTPKTTVSYIPYDNTTDSNPGGSTITGIEALITSDEKSENKGSVAVATDMFPAHSRTNIWCIRASQLNGVEVTKRGIIVDEVGTQWVVVKATLKSLATRWNCECYAKGG